MNDKPLYYVDGWGKNWYVLSRNHKTVARCNSGAMARLIARLLIKEKEHASE